MLRAGVLQGIPARFFSKFMAIDQHPRWLGFQFHVRLNGKMYDAMITDENDAEFFVETEPLNFWVDRPIFFAKLGTEDSDATFVVPN